ncbi:unnamed protein product [Rotaria sp. Silwood1]|nr:unnamed protein product [Rotaria sp. Silwood1]
MKIMLTKQGFYHYHDHSQIFRKYRHISLHNESHLNLSLKSSTKKESISFFKNEPVPLASSVVDDLTTLASAVYIISLIIIIFVLLAWITHYNAPCSSIIASILSAITGLPEPIIHSVALCGSCCMWCERTWLFRRIHQFNMWISSMIQKFISGTCKVLYDTICPCCRPPDTPSNRSIIGSLPAGIITIAQVPDIPNPSSPKTVVTGKKLEPTSASPRPLTVSVDLYSQPITESLIENQDYLPFKVTTNETKTHTNQTYENKSRSKMRRKQPRKQVQLKQRTGIGESLYIDEQTDDTSEDEDTDDEQEEENTKIY